MVTINYEPLEHLKYIDENVSPEERAHVEQLIRLELARQFNHNMDNLTNHPNDLHTNTSNTGINNRSNNRINDVSSIPQNTSELVINGEQRLQRAIESTSTPRS